MPIVATPLVPKDHSGPLNVVAMGRISTVHQDIEASHRYIQDYPPGSRETGISRCSVQRSALCRRHPAWRPTPLTALSVEAGVECDSVPASILPLLGGCWRAVFDSPAGRPEHAGHCFAFANAFPTRLSSPIRLLGPRISPM
jgi:hypothetical protein